MYEIPLPSFNKSAYCTDSLRFYIGRERASDYIRCPFCIYKFRKGVKGRKEGNICQHLEQIETELTEEYSRRTRRKYMQRRRAVEYADSKWI